MARTREQAKRVTATMVLQAKASIDKSKKLKSASKKKAIVTKKKGDPSAKKGIVTDALTLSTSVGDLNRSVTCTQYVDDDVLDKLGYRDDMLWIFGKLGLIEFMSKKWDTYPSLTLEFLDSLDHGVKNRTKNLRGQISFQLKSKIYVMSLEQVNAAYGLEHGGAQDVPREFRYTDFWTKIAGASNFEYSKTKSVYLYHPCLRYFHRILSHTIFGREGSDSIVRKDEIYLMWAALNIVKVDIGAFIVKQLPRVANSDKGKKIVIGGLITPLALSLGIDLTDHEKVEGSSRIDMGACLNMKIVSKKGDDYFSQIVNENSSEDEVYFPLPYHESYSLCHKENWFYSRVVAQVPTAQGVDAHSLLLIRPSDSPMKTPPQSDQGDIRAMIQTLIDSQKRIEKKADESLKRLQSVEANQQELLTFFRAWQQSQGSGHPNNDLVGEKESIFKKKSNHLRSR